MKKIREFLGQVILYLGAGIFIVSITITSVFVFIGNAIYYKSISTGRAEAKEAFNHFLNEVL